MRRRRVIGLMLALTLLFAGMVSAHSVIQGDLCTVEETEIVTGNLFVLCRTLVVNGIVEGNLLGAATNAIINGEVRGSIYLLGGQVDVNGTLGDDIHFAGGILHLHEDTVFEGERSDLIGASISMTVDRGVTLPSSIINAGYQLIMDGATGGDISFWGSSLTLAGEVDGNVDATVGDVQADAGWLLETMLSVSSVELRDPGLYLMPEGSVIGQLHYTSPSEAFLEGQLMSEPIYESSSPVNLTPITIGETPGNMTLYLSQVFREFFTLSIIGVAALLLAPRLLQGPIRSLRLHPFTSLGVGVPAFFVPLVMLFVITILILLIMVVLWFFQLGDLALLAGLITALFSLSSAGIFYFVAIFIARIIVCLAIGQALVRSTVGDDGSPRITYISLLVGIFSLSILGSLPMIGWLFNALTLALGLGALLIMVQAQLRLAREGTAPRYAMSYPRTAATITSFMPSDTPPPLPPPMLDDTPLPPGMDNLPDGFQWWDSEE